MILKKNFFVVLLVLLVIFTGINSKIVNAEEVTGQEIMDRVDDNLFIDSGRMESELIIYDRGRERNKEMVSYIVSDGDVTNAFVEYVSPARVRGRKYLMQGDDLWMYFPAAEDLQHISGHMLDEGMMGSDFSYQDLLESEQLSDLYEFEKEERDMIDDREVYVIKGVAREDKEPAYYQRRFWVDTERYITLREEMYARGGRVLKVLKSQDVQEVEEGRWLPLKQVMEDKLKADTHTTHRINKIELGYEVPEEKLSLDYLQ